MFFTKTKLKRVQDIASVTEPIDHFIHNFFNYFTNIDNKEIGQ